MDWASFWIGITVGFGIGVLLFDTWYDILQYIEKKEQ